MNASRPIRAGHAPAARGVVIIVALFMLITLLLAGMIYLQGQVFDGVRAYVRGEGLWAKAQKDAVLYLERYSYSHADADYAAFGNAIQVTLGDQNARRALLESPPDLAHARQGFLQGQNNAEDVDSLVWFFLNFQQISYLREAIDIWEQGDRKIADLQALAEELRHEIESGHVPAQKMDDIRAHLQTLNGDLHDLENRFSHVLGEGARWVKATLWQASLALFVVFVGAGIAVSRRIVRAIDKAERKLLASESRFRSLRESNTIGIASLNTAGAVTEANDLLLDMLGFSRADLKAGRINWKDLTPEELRARDAQAIQELQTFGRCEPYEKSFFHKQGFRVPVYLGASMLHGDKEQGIAFMLDMTERKKAEEALQLAGLVYESSSEAIVVTDASNHIIATNPAFTALTGYTFDEVCGKNPKFLSSGRHDRQFYDAMWRSLQATGTWQGEIWNRRKNGEVFAELLSINTIYGPDGRVHRRVALLLDITERKLAEEIIRQQAHYDTLTGLPNRRTVHDRLEQYMKKSRRDGLSLALLFIDLDRFKEVNDTLGHEMGDVLLKEAARRMLSCVRESDTVGRLGGDEFTVILGELGDAGSVVHIAENILDKLAAPFALGEETVNVSASIGIAYYPDDAADVPALFRNADQAMYVAKRSGRNGYHFFSNRIQ